MSSPNQLTRRQALKLFGLGTAGVALAACVPTAPPQATGNKANLAEPPKQTAPIQVATLDGELSNGVADAQKAFEAATNIKMELIKIPGADMRQKVAADLATGAGIFDVIIQPWAFVHEWQVGGHLLALDDFIAADSTINVDDFIPALYKTYGNWSGKQWTLPYKPDAQLFFYRKDLFEDPKQKDAFKAKTGQELKVPETVEEYAQVASFFTKKLNPDSPVEFGWSGMGTRWESIWWWGMRTADLGGNYFDAKMHPNFNNEAGLKALKDYLGMLKFAPDDFIQYEWTKSNTAFLTGRVAMMEQWPGLAAMVETPEGFWGKSTVGGKVGHGQPPGYKMEGKVMRSSVLGGWCAFISKYTKQPELAYKTIAWLTGPDGEPLKIDAGNAPTRKSVYKKLPSSQKTAYFPALLDNLDQSTITADVDAPPISQQLQDFLATNINKTLIGDLKPEQALEMIDTEWTKQLKDAGLYQ
ncbi:MAG: extracellular solute-binding protein [Caldilineaceae bacterium]